MVFHEENRNVPFQRPSLYPGGIEGQCSEMQAGNSIPPCSGDGLGCRLACERNPEKQEKKARGERTLFHPPPFPTSGLLRMATVL